MGELAGGEGRRYSRCPLEKLRPDWLAAQISQLTAQGGTSFDLCGNFKFLSRGWVHNFACLRVFLLCTDE